LFPSVPSANWKDGTGVFDTSASTDPWKRRTQSAAHVIREGRLRASEATEEPLEELSPLAMPITAGIDD